MKAIILLCVLIIPTLAGAQAPTAAPKPGAVPTADQFNSAANGVVDIPERLNDTTAAPGEIIARVDVFLARYFQMKAEGKLGPRSPSEATINAVIDIRSVNCAKDKKACVNFAQLGNSVCLDTTKRSSTLERKLFATISSVITTEDEADTLYRALQKCSSTPGPIGLLVLLDYIELLVKKNWEGLAQKVANIVETGWIKSTFPAESLTLLMGTAYRLKDLKKIPLSVFKTLADSILKLPLKEADFKELPSGHLENFLVDAGRIYSLVGSNTALVEFVGKHHLTANSKNMPFVVQMIENECAYLQVNGRAANCFEKVKNLRKHPAYSRDYDVLVSVNEVMAMHAVGDLQGAEQKLRSMLGAAAGSKDSNDVVWVQNLLTMILVSSNKLKEAQEFVGKVEKKADQTSTSSVFRFYLPLTKLKFYALSNDLKVATPVADSLERGLTTSFSGPTDILVWTMYQKLYVALAKKQAAEAKVLGDKIQSLVKQLPDYQYLGSLAKGLLGAGFNKGVVPSPEMTVAQKYLGEKHPYILNLKTLAEQLK